MVVPEVAVVPKSTVVPTPSPEVASKRPRKATKGKRTKANSHSEVPSTPNTEVAVTVLPPSEPAAPALSDPVAPNILAIGATATVPFVEAAFALPQASALGPIWTQTDNLGFNATTWGSSYDIEFPLLPPDLNYLNDPANFLNNFPIVSNVPMPTTIPGGFVIPPPDTYLSLLDELDGPLPASLPGVPSQINPYPMVANGATHMDTKTTDTNTTAPIASPNVEKPDTATVQANNSINAGTEAEDVDSPNADSINAEMEAKDVDTPSMDPIDTRMDVKDSATMAMDAGKGTGTANDTGAVPQPARNPRKRSRRDETDPKFIVEGKRVRKQQVRTEIEAITAKVSAEREKQKGKENQ